MRYLLRLILVSSLALVACEKKTGSLGTEKEVLVVADSLVYEQLQNALSQAFEKEIATPWPEKVFELSWRSGGQLPEVVHKPRIVLVGILNSQDEASERVHKILKPEQLEKVQRGESYVFKTDAPWKENQRLLILAASEIDTLKDRILANKDELFELFNQPLMERTKEQIYSLYEQKDIEERLMKDYGWAVRVQHDYKVFKDLPEERFVMLRRISPERWLFVNWKPANSAEQITKDWVVAWRNEIGEKFYEKDKVAEANMESREVEFAGRRALELRGLWENVSKTAGGPFRSWTFFEEVRSAIFMVDIAVFAAGIDKAPFLRQLEVMARTFHTANDLATQTDSK